MPNISIGGILYSVGKWWKEVMVVLILILEKMLRTGLYCATCPKQSLLTSDVTVNLVSRLIFIQTILRCFSSCCVDPMKFILHRGILNTVSSCSVSTHGNYQCVLYQPKVCLLKVISKSLFLCLIRLKISKIDFRHIL